MSWQRHEPWIFLSLMLLFSLLIIRVLPHSTGDVVKPLPGTLAHPPHVIDYRDAWKNSLSDAPAPNTQGDLVFVRNGYYAFEDGSYATDSDGNLIPAPSHTHTDSITGNVIYESNAQDYQPQLIHLQYSPILETCRDSDQTRSSISSENPLDGHNTYFQPGIVTMDVLRQRALGESIISQDILHGVQLQDRCYNAQDLGYANQPSYRGMVFEANCAALKGLKNGYITQAVEHALAEDTESDADLSLLKKFYTAQFCQKSTSLITSGSTQNVIQYVACGREGKQGYCQ